MSAAGLRQTAPNVVPPRPAADTAAILHRCRRPSTPAPTRQLRLLLLPPQLAQLALGRHVHADGRILRVLPHRPPPPRRAALLPLAAAPAVLVQRQPAGGAALLPLVIRVVVAIACRRRAPPVRGQEVGQGAAAAAAAAAAAQLGAKLLQRLFVPAKQLGLQLLHTRGGGTGGVRARWPKAEAARGAPPRHLAYVSQFPDAPSPCPHPRRPAAAWERARPYGGALLVRLWSLSLLLQGVRQC